MIDAANNVIIAGDSDLAHGPGNSINKDLYVAKYDGTTGERIFAAGFNGNVSSFGFDDEADDPNALPFGKGVDVAVDAFGNIAMTGTQIRRHNDVDTNTGRSGIATLKFNRFIANKGDALPDAPPLVPENAKYFTGNAPAISDNGTVVTKATIAAGKKKKSAILRQGSAGGFTLVAVQGGEAPDGTGVSTEGKWASFSDPVIAPNGNFAFAAKLSGVPASKANGVWQSINGTLKRVLQQGTPVTGVTGVNFASVTNMTMRDGQLLILGKLSGAAAQKTVLLGINNAGTPTVLARTGDTTVTLDGVESLVTAITSLNPSPTSAGDGRWQSTSSITTARLTLASKATTVVRINSAGTLAPVYYSGQTATGVAATTYKSFGLPATSSGLRLTTLATLKPEAGEATTANDTVLLYHDSTTTTPYAREDGPTPNSGDVAGLNYAGFSDPAIGSNVSTPTVAFLATLKGSGVTKKSNRALIYGSPTGTLQSAGRTGSPAPAGATLPGGTPEAATKFASFSTFTMPSGPAKGPVFVATLAGAGTNAKNNLGVFAVDSSNNVVRLLRTGQKLGDRTVKAITLLKAVPKAMSAPRSVSNGGSVAVALTFTNGENALLRLGIP